MKKIQHLPGVFTTLLLLLNSPQRDLACTLSANRLTPSGGATEVLLKKGTEVTLETMEPASSATRSGSVIELSAYTDIKVDEYTVINTGRYAAGEASVRRAGFFGRPGRVSLRAVTVQTVEGAQIPLECVPVVSTGDNRYALAIVGSILLPAIGIALGPMHAWAWYLTPAIGIGFLIKGKEVEIPARTKIRAFVKRDVYVRV